MRSASLVVMLSAASDSYDWLPSLQAVPSLGPRFAAPCCACASAALTPPLRFSFFAAPGGCRVDSVQLNRACRNVPPPCAPPTKQSPLAQIQVQNSSANFSLQVQVVAVVACAPQLRMLS